MLLTLITNTTIIIALSSLLGYGVARVMLGDYYYYGYGTEQDMELAVDQYRLASDRLSNPQAMFNLGYMYENGIGLQQVLPCRHNNLLSGLC